jgi:MYXO-CTERM domain-containing protein
VQKLNFAADGTIPKLPFWDPKGVAQVGTLNPYVKTEAETIAWSQGLKTETCSEGGMNVTNIDKGEFIKVAGVDFGGGATSLDVRVASAGSGGGIEVRLDSQTGTLVGTCAVTGTGGAQTWTTKTCPISGASGVHDLYFVFTGDAAGLFNFNWWQFTGTPSDGGTGAGGQSGVDAATPTGGTGGAGAGGAGGTRTSGAGGAGGARTSGAGGTGGSTVGGTTGQSSGGAISSTGGRGGSQTTSSSSGQGGSGGSGGITASAGAGASGSSSSSTGGQRSSEGGAGGATSSAAQGGGPGSGGASGSGGKTSSSTASGGSSSGCSCDFGGARYPGGGLIGLAVALGLWLGRRRRRGG